MNIFGKPLSDYVRFSRLFLVLIAVTGLVRLALSLGGVPNSTVKWFSMTGLMWIAVVYYAIRIHKTGFGTYKHLLPVLAVLNVVFQAIAIRSEEHTSELQSLRHLVCRLLLEKKNINNKYK